MEQIQKFKEQEQESVSLERSIGNLFEDFLESKGRLADYDRFSQRTNVSIDGHFVRLTAKGFPALVKDVLKMVVKPSQEVKFHPAVAGG